MYYFCTQLRKGEIAEQMLDTYFLPHYRIQYATMAQQREGIDRIFHPRTGAASFTLQYKADWTASRTGDAFVETVSVDSCRIPGWVYTSTATWLVYYLPVDSYAYALRMATVRAAVSRWRHQYRTRRIPNHRYHTVGILVPLGEFEQLCDDGYGLVLNIAVQTVL
jgi:hypothetical protein